MDTKIKELFLPYKLALIAKEKGFDEACIVFYGSKGFLQLGDSWDDDQTNSQQIPEGTNYCMAPLYQQIVDWFREKHRIDIDISCDYERVAWWFGYRKTGYAYRRDYSIKFKSYYEALNKAIQEAFKLI